MAVVMFTLFALVVVGYVAGKLGYLGGDFDRQLSRLVINITCPALILSSAMTGELPDRQFILPLLLISTLTYIVLTAVAFFLPRYLTKRREDEGAIGFALMFGNVGFMGYPVVASIFGHEAVFYAAVLNVVNTFAVFTVGTVLITGKNEVEGSRFEKKVLYSTPMLAAYLTMLIVALRIDNIPQYVSQPLRQHHRAGSPAHHWLVNVTAVTALADGQHDGLRDHGPATGHPAARRPLPDDGARVLTFRCEYQYGGYRDARGYLRHHPLSEIREGHDDDYRGDVHHHPAVDAYHPPARHILPLTEEAHTT